MKNYAKTHELVTKAKAGEDAAFEELIYISRNIG